MQRSGHALSILVVTAMCASWLSISNHCVIGSSMVDKAQAQTSASECPFHAKQSKPEKPKSDSNSAPCCKILRALAVKTAKPVRNIVDLAGFDVEFSEAIVAEPPGISSPLSALATGPPGKTSFSELTGSVRAHAPPVLAGPPRSRSGPL